DARKSCSREIVLVLLVITVFFFFQAEDGIRDFHVTGVQTCALPIFGGHGAPGVELAHNVRSPEDVDALLADVVRASGHCARARRSEERRVGKECRSWSSGYSSKSNHLT